MKRLRVGPRSRNKRLKVLNPKLIIFINPLTKAQVNGLEGGENARARE